MQLIAIGFNRFLGRSKLTAFAQDMDMPALFDHIPVGFVTVHRNDHASAAAGNLRIEGAVAQLRQQVFNFFNID